MIKLNGTNSITPKMDVGAINAGDTRTSALNSTFGDGFAASGNIGFVSVDSRFQDLAAKFDFEAPKYPKGGFAQLSVSDKDYETMRHLDAVLDKPEAAYCEG